MNVLKNNDIRIKLNELWEVFYEENRHNDSFNINEKEELKLMELLKEDIKLFIDLNSDMDNNTSYSLGYGYLYEYKGIVYQAITINYHNGDCDISDNLGKWIITTIKYGDKLDYQCGFMIKYEDFIK